MKDFGLFNQFDEYLCKMHGLNLAALKKFTDELMSEDDADKFIFYSFNEQIVEANEILERYKHLFNEEPVIFTLANIDNNGIYSIGKYGQQFFLDILNDKIIHLEMRDILVYNTSIYTGKYIIGLSDFRFDNVLEIFVYDVQKGDIIYYPLDKFIDKHKLYHTKLFELNPELCLIELSTKSTTILLLFSSITNCITKLSEIEIQKLFKNINAHVKFVKNTSVQYKLLENNIASAFVGELNEEYAFIELNISNTSINLKGSFTHNLNAEIKGFFNIVEDTYCYSENELGIVKKQSNLLSNHKNYKIRGINVVYYSNTYKTVFVGTFENTIVMLDTQNSIMKYIDVKALPIKIIENNKIITVFCKKGFVYCYSNNSVTEKRVILDDVFGIKFSERTNVIRINEYEE